MNMPACVICGEPNALGLRVCAACGGTAPEVADELLFVKPDPVRADRRRVARALESLLTGRAHSSELQLVAAGHQALIRVPRAAADATIEHLADQGIPAIARNVRRAWCSLPGTFYLLLATIVGVGVAAGASAADVFTWGSPVVALLLLLGAQTRLKQPAIGAFLHGGSAFAPESRRLMVETLSALREPRARELLAQLVRAAQPAYDAAHAQRARALADDVSKLVEHACLAAIDFADLEFILSTPGNVESKQRVAGRRDQVEDSFRRATRVLHRLRTDAVDGNPAHEALSDLLERLERETEARIEARHEIRELLRVGARRFRHVPPTHQ